MSNFSLDVTSRGSTKGAFELLFEQHDHAPVTWWAYEVVDRWHVGTVPTRSGKDLVENIVCLLLGYGPNSPSGLKESNWQRFLVPYTDADALSSYVDIWLSQADRGREPDIDGSMSRSAWQVRDTQIGNPTSWVSGIWGVVYPVWAEFHK